MMAPTLIIGLGGVGSEIVSMVERKCKDLNIDMSNMKFVLLDTDNTSLNRLKNQGFGGTTIEISRNVTVIACLKSNPHASEEWYPNNGIFNNKTLTDGAGQVRAISRLALEDAIQCGKMSALQADIHTLHETHRNMEDKTLRIAIVSSLAGGTGSGIILPLGVYIGQYLEQEYPENGYNMSGFFMLPDILMQANRGNVIEKMSLNSNAYATLKELDAYIQGTVGTTDLKIDISFEKNGAGQIRPAIYNFSFLFGPLNNGNSTSTLHNIVYYEKMMADCIYLPYCSPINEINGSREDNKFKHLAIQLGVDVKKKYKHFGSIGVSRIMYPYHMVRKYLTMVWVEDVLENRWFQYDRAYEAELKKHYEKVKSGKKNGAFMERRTFYLYGVENGNDSFSEQIKKNLNREGCVEPTWKAYVDKVERYIKDKVGNEVSRNGISIARAAYMLKKRINEMHLFVGSRAKKCKSEYEKLFIALCRKNQGLCQKLQERIVEELNVRHDSPARCDAYLECWITEKSGGAMYNPNTVRYFLGKVYEILCDRIQQYEIEKAERQEEEDRQIELIRKTEKYKKRELKKRVQDMEDESRRRWTAEVVFFVMHAHMEYIEKLYENFEVLFDEFHREMDELERKKYLLKVKLEEVFGTTGTNVCCDEDTLNRMFKKMKAESIKYYGENDRVYAWTYRVATDMTRQIREKKNETTDKWATLLEEWENTFQLLYGGEYDMDVISAIEWQNSEKKDFDAEVEIKRVIEKTRENVGMPFLKVSRMKGQTTLSENYFHSSLLKMDGVKGKIVREELVGKDGIDEKQVIDKYTIYFYKSLFGVHISELAKLEEFGEYYKDYEEVTKNIHLNANRDQILTPHIDKSWHRPDRLQEITEERQDKVQIRVWKALIYGLIDGGLDRGEIWKRDIRGKESGYSIQASSIKHEETADLNEMIDLLREFPDDRCFILMKMNRDLKKQRGVYRDSDFFKYYAQTNLIEDIFYQCFQNKEYTEESKCQVNYFLCAWESMLQDFLNVYLKDSKGEIREMVNVQARKFKNCIKDSDRDKYRNSWVINYLNKLFKDRGYEDILSK